MLRWRWAAPQRADPRPLPAPPHPQPAAASGGRTTREAGDRDPGSQGSCLTGSGSRWPGQSLSPVGSVDARCLPGPYRLSKMAIIIHLRGARGRGRGLGRGSGPAGVPSAPTLFVLEHSRLSACLLPADLPRVQLLAGALHARGLPCLFLTPQSRQEQGSSAPPA